MIKQNIIAVIGNKFVGKTKTVNIFKEFGYMEIKEKNIDMKILNNRLYDYSRKWNIREVINDIDSQNKLDYIKFMNGKILEIQNPYQTDEFEERYFKYRIKPDFIIYNTGHGINYYKEDLVRLIKKLEK